MVANFSRKRNREFFKTKLLFQIGGVLFLIIIIVLIFVDFKIYQKKRELTSQINSYKKQVEDIKESIQSLKDEIANSDNIDYLERIAYEQLGEQKPGEKAVIFISQQEKAKEVLVPESSFLGAWLAGLWDWLKGKF